MPRRRFPATSVVLANSVAISCGVGEEAAVIARVKMFWPLFALEFALS